MTQRMPPGANLSLRDFSREPSERHERFIDLFGQFIMWMRNCTNDSARRLVESSDAREQLGTILREPYEQVANLSIEDRERALRLVESSIDAFIILLLRVLSHLGNDFPLGNGHAIRYRLEMEIIDQETDNIVHRETVNRDGKKHFADYWGRWLNRYTKT
jgi:hypothetical protein